MFATVTWAGAIWSSLLEGLPLGEVREAPNFGCSVQQDATLWFCLFFVNNVDAKSDTPQSYRKDAVAVLLLGRHVPLATAAEFASWPL
jgi:hypothetical protein